MEAIITAHSTYLEAFLDVVGRRRDVPLMTFFENGTGDGVVWTAGDLDREARRVALQLRGKVGVGEPVLLMASPGLDYVAAFFGAVYAGALPVPAYPPSPMHGKANMARLEAVAESAGCSFGLTTDSLRSTLEGFAVQGTLLEWIYVSRDTPDPDLEESLPSVSANDVAFLQYTSGSTGDPKGVMVTQGNLLANTQMIAQTYDLQPEETMVSWLPPYHDMGLIGTLLAPAILDMHAVFMPPPVFLRRPIRWLQLIARYPGCTSPAPNFAYESCATKIKDADLVGLDLSGWKNAINGAEPVRAATLERFTERFRACGFNPAAHRPSYGLAEATLLTSAGLPSGPRIVLADSASLQQRTMRLADGSGDATKVVSNGIAPTGTQLRVVDVETRQELPAGEVGEIEVSGSHVTRGYWLRPDATDERFDGDTVRTGDLGCMFEGELLITGRLKDLIIIRGRNFAAHDIELTVEDANENFRRNAGATFAVLDDEGEQLVVVQEINPAMVDDLAAVVEQIRRAVTTVHGVSPAAVVLARFGTVLKTSSGKIRRSETRQLYEQGELDAIFSWRAGHAAESRDALVP